MTSIFELPADFSDDEELDPTTRSWKEARNIVAVVGPCPRLFTTAVHFLNLDQANNEDVAQHSAKACINLLLHSDSFTAALYYAALTYKEPLLRESSLGRRVRIVDLFQASEMSALIAILYLYRRLRKGCDKELFAKITEEMIVDIELAGKIGYAIPAIGLQYGLLVGALPHLGRAMLLGIDKKKYKKYRLGMKVENKEFDLDAEHKIWGCNHLQIAVLLAQVVGIKGEILDPILRGLPEKFLSDTEKEEDMYRAKLTSVWLHSLRDRGEIPNMLHKGEYYPMASQVDHLTHVGEHLSKEGTLTRWLERNKEDIGPKKTPELIRFPKKENTEDLTEHLPDELSEEDIQSGEMTENEMG